MSHEAGVRVHWQEYPTERFEFAFEFFSTSSTESLAYDLGWTP
jgi:hypothetical protein